MADEKPRKEEPKAPKEKAAKVPEGTGLFDPFERIGTEARKHRSTDAFDF